MKMCSIIMMVLSLILAFAVSADAALTRLPVSNHYSGVSHYTTQNNGQVSTGRIEFAVYDTANQSNPFGQLTVPGQGRFIYAYQIFNDSAPNAAFPALTLGGIGKGAIASNSDIGTIEDPSGVNASSQYFNTDRSTATFEFANGILAAGNNSWFLILRSEQNYRVGSYSVSAPPASDDTVVPDDGNNSSIPEPATMVLLLSGVVALSKRSK